jgi:hypothetical protein
VQVNRTEQNRTYRSGATSDRIRSEVGERIWRVRCFQSSTSSQQSNLRDLTAVPHSPLNTPRLKHVSALTVSAFGGGAGNESV